VPKLLLELVKILPLLAAGLAYLIVSEWISDKRRRRILSGLAAARGYEFVEEDTSQSEPFFENLATWHILRRFEIHKVKNILHGPVNGTEFAYFEQHMIAANGSIALGGRHGGNKLNNYVQSVMAVAIPGAANFEWEAADHQNIKVKRNGDWVYFWPPKTQIAAKNVESFLAQVFELVQAGMKKYQNC
jgi:hypothetical protein